MSQHQELARLPVVPTTHLVSPAKCCCAHAGPSSPSSPPCPQAEAGIQGKGWKHMAACASMEVESIFDSPKARPCSANTGHGCPLLGASRWPLVPCPGSPVGACVGCSAAGIPEVEHAGSSPSATCLDAGAGGPSSRAAEDLKPVPCLGTIHWGVCRSVHPASWYASDLPFLFQLLLLQWLLDSPGAEGPLCPLPVLQDEGFVAAAAWYKPAWCAPELITAACQPRQPGQTWTRQTSPVPLPRSMCVFRRGEHG